MLLISLSELSLEGKHPSPQISLKYAQLIYYVDFNNSYHLEVSHISNNKEIIK
jgi:hypothetical protein